MESERLKFLGNSAGYVFYATLADDPNNQQLAKNIISSYTNFTDKGSGEGAAKQTASILRNMGRAEAQKELTAMKIYFNGLVTDLDESQLFTKDFLKKLTVAIQYAFSSKEIFERYYTRITGSDVNGNRVNKSGNKYGHAKITIAKFMPGYIATAFKRALEAQLPDRQYTSSQDLQNEIQKILNQSFINQTMQEGIYRALESGDWKAGDKQGLLEIKQEIEKMTPQARNDLINQIYEALRVDQIIDLLNEEIKKGTLVNDTDRKNAITKVSGTLATKMNTNKNVGEFAEFFGAMTANLLAGKKMSNGYIEATQTGQSGTKHDIVIRLESRLQSANYEQIVDNLFDEENTEDTNSTRAKNVQITKEAYKKISGLENKDGFIIYANAKDYTLLKNGSEKDSNFGKRGFSAGDPQNLLNFRQTWAHISDDAEKLSNAIAQLLHGTLVMEQEGNGFKEAIEQQLMRDLAYFLFDDFETIGNIQESTKALHFLYLDGIYIPLSYVLLLIADAVEYTGTDPKRMFKVNISTSGANSGKILYPQAWNKQTWTKEMWDKQRQDAYNITVAAHFLRNFIEIVEDLMK